MALFGERIDGERAAALGWRGRRWTTPTSSDGDRAGRRARAPTPSSRAAPPRSLRTELGPPPLPWPAALELERASQMWSMRRKALG